MYFSILISTNIVIFFLFHNIDSSENTDICDISYNCDEDKLYVPPINSNDDHLKKRLYLQGLILLKLYIYLKLKLIYAIDRVSSNNELLSGKQLCASPLNFNHLENDNIGKYYL